MVKEGHKPELIIIAGPNGSGKTSVTKRFLHHEWAEGTTYINPDEVANEMFGDWNNKEAVLSAANYCAEWRERCLEEKTSFVFETVMSAIEKELVAMAEKEVGDDPSFDLYYSGARGSISNNYKQLSITKGPVFNKTIGKYQFIQKSFFEGMRITSLMGLVKMNLQQQVQTL